MRRRYTFLLTGPAPAAVTLKWINVRALEDVVLADHAVRALVPDMDFGGRI